LALDSGTLPEKLELEPEDEDAAGAGDDAAADGAAGPLGQIMNPTRTTASNPSALAAITFVRFSLPIFTLSPCLHESFQFHLQFHVAALRFPHIDAVHEEESLRFFQIVDEVHHAGIAARERRLNLNAP